MVKVAVFVRLEVKRGKEADMEKLLCGGLDMALQEEATPVWLSLRIGPSTFGIFDAFVDEEGRQSHLSGPIAAALMKQAKDLLKEPPVIEMMDVLAAKLPRKAAEKK
ncbi:MAG: antibiotic biosynthesis monooxygenase [Deltaproteobacteria bacterium]|nr:antibiotic biosynthesis monooxygenase [Deltaproteobacteria bacterium]